MREFRILFISCIRYYIDFNSKYAIVFDIKNSTFGHNIFRLHFTIDILFVSHIIYLNNGADIFHIVGRLYR